MSQSRRHERDIALPLLSDHQDPRVTGQQAISEDWNSSPHGKYSKWVAFPFRRMLHVLLGIIALVILALATWGSLVGFHAYRRLVFPHRAVHASSATARDGSRVVSPYFAPTSKGGVSSGILLVRIWFQDGGIVPAHNGSRDVDWRYLWRQERQLESMSSIGETGYIDDTVAGLEGQGTWVEQFTTELPIGNIERTQDMVSHVTLPGPIMYVNSLEREVVFSSLTL